MTAEGEAEQFTVGGEDPGDEDVGETTRDTDGETLEDSVELPE
jgi:hypothetical protein